MARFELNISLPPQTRFAETMRELAAHAARYAGAGESDAVRYGAAVERVVVACLEKQRPGALVPVTLRRETGPVEFLIGCDQRFPVDEANNARITISWAPGASGQMCRVTFDASPV